MRRSAGGLLMIAAALAACADSRDGGETKDGFAPTAQLREMVRIDGHEKEFLTIGTTALSDGGTLAINQARLGRLLFFNDDGADAGFFGGAGDGPGEFRNPYRLGFAGDTLWVYDGILRRITWIGPGRELVRIQASIPQAAEPPDDADGIPLFPFAFPIAPLPDGSILAMLDPAVGQEVPEAFRGRTVMGRMSSDGVVEAIVLFPPRGEGGYVTTGGSSASVPFGNPSHTALSPDRRTIAVVMAPLTGDNPGSFSLDVVDLSGDTLLSRSYPLELDILPQEVADSALDRRLASLQDSPDLQNAVRRYVPPAYYPPITNLLIGNDGTYWVELRETAEGRSYHVIAEDGSPLGSVHLPGGAKVTAVDGSRLWTIELDMVDVPHLVRYELTWPDQS